MGKHFLPDISVITMIRTTKEIQQSQLLQNYGYRSMRNTKMLCKLLMRLNMTKWEAVTNLTESEIILNMNVNLIKYFQL